MAETNDPPPGSTTPPEASEISAGLLVDNWHMELDAVELYRRLARHERSKDRADVLLEMAETEVRHADVMTRRLQEMGIPLPNHRIGLRVRLLSLLARVFGVRSVLPIVESMEASGATDYLAPEQDPAVVGLGAGEAHHQGQVGDQPIVYPEDRRPQRAAAAGAVPAFVPRDLRRPGAARQVAQHAKVAQLLTRQRGHRRVLLRLEVLGRARGLHPFDDGQHGTSAEDASQQAQDPHL